MDPLAAEATQSLVDAEANKIKRNIWYGYLSFRSLKWGKMEVYMFQVLIHGIFKLNIGTSLEYQ